jgi:hypothetical protein
MFTRSLISIAALRLFLLSIRCFSAASRSAFDVNLEAFLSAGATGAAAPSSSFASATSALLDSDLALALALALTSGFASAIEALNMEA